MNDIKFPEIEVQLAGEDGNAFSIIGRVQKAMRSMDIPKADVDLFVKEATSGDYSKLLRTCEAWVTCF